MVWCQLAPTGAHVQLDGEWCAESHDILHAMLDQLTCLLTYISSHLKQQFIMHLYPHLAYLTVLA